MLKIRNKLLYDKTKKLAFDGLRLAQDYLATDGNNFVSNYNEWQFIGGFSSFMQLNVQKTNHRALVGHVSESINLLESYKDALNEMNKDNIWNRHNDQIIGTFMGDQRFKFGDLINYTISSFLELNNAPCDFECHFDEQIERVESAFISNDIEYTRHTPIWGVTINSKVSLSDDLCIEPISNEFIVELLGIGLISNLFNSSYIGRVPRAMISKKISQAKHVRDDCNYDNIDQAPKLFHEVKIEETLVIDLLTLTLDAAIKPLGSVTKSANYMHGCRQYEKNDVITPAGITDITIDKSNEDKLVDLWCLLSRSQMPKKTKAEEKTKNLLIIAIRRFSLAMTRQSLDDKIIDLMICAEALFVGDEGPEITYRLSHRAALLLGESEIESKNIFDFFKKSYKMRSDVVHGSKSYSESSVAADNLKTMTDKLSSLLRDAILKILGMAFANPDQKELINWKDLMFKNKKT